MLIPARLLPRLAALTARATGVKPRRQPAQPLDSTAVAPPPPRDADRAGAPIVLHRGVWSATATYQRGDTTLHRGSLWLALVDNDGVDPGASGKWSMLNRRGKDGKDAALTDASVKFFRDNAGNATRVEIRAKDTRELLATIKPHRDADGYLDYADIAVPPAP